MADLTNIVCNEERLTLNELLDILATEDEDQIPASGLDIAILPPENDVTDEDSGAEDNPSMDNLPGSQLRPEVVVFGRDKIKTINRPTTAGRERSPSPPPNPRVKKRKKIVKSYKWRKQELPELANEWPQMMSCFEEKGKRTPLEYFRLFVDEQIIDLFVKFTNQYAAKKNLLGNCTENEILVFIAILLLSGYVNVPRKIMYWQSDQDSHNSLVSNAISRDRFQFIMSNIHVCDNDKLDKTDRFAKIRPLLKMLNEKFLNFMPHEQNHSVDESMVPYFGSHGAKQFIKGKPIRFGMKFWCGGTSNGYLTWLEPYQGANTCSQNYDDKGMGYGVVMTYVDQLPANIPYQIYFDNLFTSFQLLSDLKDRGIGATGTIRANRVDKSCPLASVDQIKKNKNRGAFEYCTDIESGICITRWNDNNIVSIATNFDQVQPVKRVNRFSREQKKKIQVPQPKVLNNYNKYMGGIDRADQNISLYRCGIRGKKWYFPLLAHLIDVSEQNAWSLYNRFEENMDHLSFRRRVATAILETNKRVVTHRGRPSSSALIDSRSDGIDHLVCSLPISETTGKKQQLICRHCHTKSTTKCIKCDVPLHVDCFINFHKK